MKRLISIILITFICSVSCKNEKQDNAANATEDSKAKAEIDHKEEQQINISPIEHATMVLEYNGATIYVDPVGGKKAFLGQKRPDLVLVTDIHGDHLNVETLEKVATKNTKIIAPQAVYDKLSDTLKPRTKVLRNIEKHNLDLDQTKVQIEAIPMYNLREEALKFHPKGRGNGYVMTLGKKRIYISGDTEDIPEMRNLRNIDMAFVCMNLPYTMTVESAAEAVLDFKPKTVYPYHYRGTDGLGDVGKFKGLINQSNKEIEVVQLNWYD